MRNSKRNKTQASGALALRLYKMKFEGGASSFPANERTSVYVSNGVHLMHNAPVGAMACHCIEPSLKAVLLNRGYTAEQVIDFRHNLKKLFNETRHAGLDWSDLEPKRLPSTQKRC